MPSPAPSEEASTPPIAPGVNKFLLFAWLLTSALFVFLYGYVFLHGSTPDRTNLAKDIGAVWGVLGAFLIGPMWKAFKRVVGAPYRALIYSFVCFTGVAAISAFRLAFATAQGSPNAFSQDSLPLVGLIVTAIWASRSWSAILRVEPDADPAFSQKHKAFGLKAGAVIVIILVCVISGGIFFGIRAAHQTRLAVLFEEVHDLGQKAAPEKQRFMQLTRKDSHSLPEYLQRCAELEPAVNDYEATERQMDNLLSKMQQEVQEIRPQGSYANLIPLFTTLRAVLGKDLEAAGVYRQEIGYAKQLPGMPQSDRLQFFNANIRPVLEQEVKVANDEVAILKDAKARGIQLPEELYKDAGIS